MVLIRIQYTYKILSHIFNFILVRVLKLPELELLVDPQETLFCIKHKHDPNNKFI